MKRAAIIRKTPMSRGSAPLRRDPGQAKASVPIPKKRQCENKTCKTPFTRTAAFQTWCSPSCGYEVAKARLAKAETKRQAAERAADKVKRESLRTRSDWLKLAQAAFNKFIRARDAALPCISCQRFHAGSYDAGHYRTVGSSPALRFDEAQVHRQCVPCNQHLHGNTLAYRAGLIARVGLAEVERIEGPHEPKKYTADDLRGIRDTYRAKARNLERQA